MSPDPNIGLGLPSPRRDGSCERTSPGREGSGGTFKVSTEPVIEGESTDNRVTLKTHGGGETGQGDRVDVGAVAGLIWEFQALAENHPEHFAVLRGLVSGQTAPNSHLSIEYLRRSGLVDRTGGLKSDVREVFRAACGESPDGKVTFDESPFAPVSEDERLTLLRFEARRDQERAGMMRAIRGGNEDPPPRR